MGRPLSDTIAVFDSVSKEFTRSINRPRTFQEGFLRLFMPRRRQENGPEAFHALRDISFTVERGSMLGLVGENGSGKSTVLKLLCRILEPTTGTIAINGRVAALLELGAGFHPELTGRENIYMMGSLHGLGQREMADRVGSVIDFSGLDDFIDVPVKHYSSGMYMRLGFSTMIHLDADILLVDEILAVGDQMFQRKCLAKIAELRRNGKTILFVSHDLNTVRELCDRVIWIDDGLVMADGLPREVTSRYLLQVWDRQRRVHDEGMHDPAASVLAADPRSASRWGNRQVEITGVELSDGTGASLNYLQTGDPLQITVQYQVNDPTEDLVFGIGIFRQDGLCCYGTNNAIESIRLSDLGRQGELTLSCDNLWLLDGEYTLDVAAHSRDERPYDYWRGWHSFSVHSLKQDVGVFRPALHWSLNGEILEPDRVAMGDLDER
jgi:ABC-type polysaccharide/polyol phosphate transport system ATPase subunit